MKKIVYNKLIRDKILEIIEKSNKTASYKVINDSEEVQKLLLQKLREEMDEVLGATSQEELFEELADVLEVVYRIAQVNGLEVEQLEKIRCAKREKRGGFEKNIFLESVEG